MNEKQRNALREIQNFILYYASDEAVREKMYSCALEYVEQDHVLQKEDAIFIEWCIDDVKDVREDLDDDQAMEVLEYVKDNHDATIGVSWETLQSAADLLYPEELLEVELLP
jgi:hypothetical protein